MRRLAKVRFGQSYPYFAWKNSRHELTEYVLELAYSGEQEHYRAHFFVNTPDVLHVYLEQVGRPAPRRAVRYISAAKVSTPRMFIASL